MASARVLRSPLNLNLIIHIVVAFVFLFAAERRSDECGAELTISECQNVTQIPLWQQQGCPPREISGEDRLMTIVKDITPFFLQHIFQCLQEKLNPGSPYPVQVAHRLVSKRTDSRLIVALGLEVKHLLPLIVSTRWGFELNVPVSEDEPIVFTFGPFVQGWFQNGFVKVLASVGMRKFRQKLESALNSACSALSNRRLAQNCEMNLTLVEGPDKCPNQAELFTGEGEGCMNRCMQLELKGVPSKHKTSSLTAIYNALMAKPIPPKHTSNPERLLSICQELFPVKAWIRYNKGQLQQCKYTVYEYDAPFTRGQIIGHKVLNYTLATGEEAWECGLDIAAATIEQDTCIASDSIRMIFKAEMLVEKVDRIKEVLKQQTAKKFIVTPEPQWEVNDIAYLTCFSAARLESLRGDNIGAYRYGDGIRRDQLVNGAPVRLGPKGEEKDTFTVRFQEYMPPVHRADLPRMYQDFKDVKKNSLVVHVSNLRPLASKFDLTRCASFAAKRSWQEYHQSFIEGKKKEFQAYVNSTQQMFDDMYKHISNAFKSELIVSEQILDTFSPRNALRSFETSFQPVKDRAEEFMRSVRDEARQNFDVFAGQMGIHGLLDACSPTASSPSSASTRFGSPSSSSPTSSSVWSFLTTEGSNTEGSVTRLIDSPSAEDGKVDAEDSFAATMANFFFSTCSVTARLDEAHGRSAAREGKRKFDDDEIVIDDSSPVSYHPANDFGHTGGGHRGSSRHSHGHSHSNGYNQADRSSSSGGGGYPQQPSLALASPLDPLGARQGGAYQPGAPHASSRHSLDAHAAERRSSSRGHHSHESSRHSHRDHREEGRSSSRDRSRSRSSGRGDDDSDMDIGEEGGIGIVMPPASGKTTLMHGRDRSRSRRREDDVDLDVGGDEGIGIKMHASPRPQLMNGRGANGVSKPRQSAKPPGGGQRHTNWGYGNDGL
eukprot:TRINITY_DN18593_c0_g1_i1.p1 TRINITY_DN18593_c0_g1~~TRINITY_DN18593_c0_g1_i1.p1  ORF type:complete len:943 (-),score=62.49 TRINITY_DN18593_c0_g1_i1:217-3045(-)